MQRLRTKTQRLRTNKTPCATSRITSDSVSMLATANSIFKVLLVHVRDRITIPVTATYGTHDQQNSKLLYSFADYNNAIRSLATVSNVISPHSTQRSFDKFQPFRPEQLQQFSPDSLRASWYQLKDTPGLEKCEITGKNMNNSPNTTN